eukprot:235042-Pyramimonas_sp.AAC.1
MFNNNNSNSNSNSNSNNNNNSSSSNNSNNDNGDDDDDGPSWSGNAAARITRHAAKGAPPSVSACHLGRALSSSS